MHFSVLFSVGIEGQRQSLREGFRKTSSRRGFVDQQDGRSSERVDENAAR